ncbi:hypothetical protein M427DRAFT_166115 [Gonapodya prolifera JEL478]|uniref:WD40 repeat-like protein n=1 Tax=Gonapodya prolifera (strain JEL478) TaxID=1344416 RepID=A0A139AZI6_GONPJ|nr:hypothetical protein M427DRAFT_166115 [Gonapodya prolifera JEL478]|eukprot:KXS22152.1 hypothetical protein M427DRAFT_166115 [Gonapodya prolifera JEL478]
MQRLPPLRGHTLSVVSLYVPTPPDGEPATKSGDSVSEIGGSMVHLVSGGDDGTARLWSIALDKKPDNSDVTMRAKVLRAVKLGSGGEDEAAVSAVYVSPSLDRLLAAHGPVVRARLRPNFYNSSDFDRERRRETFYILQRWVLRRGIRSPGRGQRGGERHRCQLLWKLPGTGKRCWKRKGVAPSDAQRREGPGE